MTLVEYYVIIYIGDTKDYIKQGDPDPEIESQSVGDRDWEKFERSRVREQNVSQETNTTLETIPVYTTELLGARSLHNLKVINLT